MRTLSSFATKDDEAKVALALALSLLLLVAITAPPCEETSGSREETCWCSGEKFFSSDREVLSCDDADDAADSTRLSIDLP